jgi:HAD superfamily hydrolase (TIGR01509 family)
VSRYRAVLLDWRGTLVHDPGLPWWIERALTSIGRPADPGEIARLTAALTAVPEPGDLDTSRERHREGSLAMFAQAGLDDELAEALYALDFLPECHPLYPDAIEVLSALRDGGVRTVLVSDIHVDLRADMAALGAGGLLDAYVLSFEHGVQKPDPAIFRLGLEAAGVEAGEALMVGDRPSHDGGAVAVGIDTLLLPLPERADVRRLDAVLRLVG